MQPDVTIADNRYDINNSCNFAKQIATLCEYPTVKRQILRIKKQLNTCIREGIEIDEQQKEARVLSNVDLQFFTGNKIKK